uniref:Uncharacterized protein n=1 Tax=Avena sativa TaxID=4498 RepID=A0ACD5Z6B5_AVESA
MDLSSQSSAAGLKVLTQEKNGAVGEKVDAAERRGAMLGASLVASGLGTEGGVVPEMNGVASGGEMIAASDGRGAGTKVGAAPEANILGISVAAGLQMQGDRFYCHQCRQPRTRVAPACKGGSKKKGNCLLKYCVRCIHNRYPEIADEVLQEEAWECPKCQNICDCSVCMKNKGKAPTGQKVCPGRKRKGSVDDTPANKKPLFKAEDTDAYEDNIDLPRGTLVTCVAGIELHPEDVGTAIQFLECCRLFGQIFKLREGQPEQTVKEIAGGFQLREVPSVVSDLHINLLSIIEKGKTKACGYPRHGDEWIRKVRECIAKSTLAAKDLTLDCLNQGVSGYKNMTPCKLDVLNCLCIEALSSQREPKESVAKEKKSAATKKLKLLEERRKDLTEPMDGGESASNEKIENISSQIKEAHAVKQWATNELEELGRVSKTALIRLDKGVAYWKLDGYSSNNTNIMRQEFDDENTVNNNDKWFMFTEEEQKVIEDHLAKR